MYGCCDGCLGWVFFFCIAVWVTSMATAGRLFGWCKASRCGFCLDGLAVGCQGLMAWLRWRFEGFS